MDGSLSVCSDGSDAGSSYEVTKQVSMAGLGLTAWSIGEELTVGRPGRAPRWGGVALDSRGNGGGVGFGEVQGALRRRWGGSSACEPRELRCEDFAADAG